MGLPGTGLPEAMRDLLELPDQTGVILTANARAARALHRRHAQQQVESDRKGWRTPPILDLDSWLTEQWQTLLLSSAEERLLLNDVQEQALWQRIVTPSLAGRSLIAPAHMTSLAQQAYGLLAAHCALGWLRDASWGADSGGESELFRQWARSFREECRTRGWLPHCELSQAVTTALRSGTLPPPQQVGWLGFDRQTPAQHALRQALDDAGAAHRDLSWEAAGSEPALYAAASTAEEATACARWARAQLAANPAARLGILAPELSAVRAPLERALHLALAPQKFPITAGAATLPFEFAVGMPLADTPLVHAALLLLRWLDRPLPQQDITWLLLSSTLSLLERRREAAAAWDARLRNVDCAAPELSLDVLLRQPGAGAAAIAPLREQLHAMLQTYRRYSRTATAGVWTQRIDELLRLAHWGAMSDATSLLYQVRQAWESLLDAVASLDYDGRSFTYAELLERLERFAAETVFAPESNDAPVQVMSAFAAAGQAFDAVWFLSASDAQWPPAGRPHSLLPPGLQREFGMPHATPAINTELAHRITARILGSAGAVVFSYPWQNAEAAIQQPSPLVHAFAAFPSDTVPVTDVAMLLEEVADDTWVPLPASVSAKGGARTLKLQADCPFQSFAFQRLDTRELPLAGRGLSPVVRGKLLHTVLEDVWSKDTADLSHLTDRASLHAALANDTLRPLVTVHTAQAFAALVADRSQGWQRAYLAAEEQRLVDLVVNWLSFESTRQEFRVAEVEKPIDLQIGSLALKVRVDRIDEVASGRLLIDYKSGEASTASWESTRPEEPQLPLYAAFGDVPQLTGALFAEVRPKNFCFKGRVENACHDLLQSLTSKSPLVSQPYGAHLLEEWHASLTTLAESFVRGEALVDPREYPKTCRFCPLSGLCRIADAGHTVSDAVDEEETPA